MTTRNRYRRFARVLVPIFILSGCHVTLVSDYDDAYDQQLVAAQKDVDTLLEKLIQNTDPSNTDMTAEKYASNSDAYTKINVELDALLVRARAHPDNGPTVDQVRRLQNSFNEFQTEHKTTTVSLHVQHVKDELSAFNGEFGVLMATELLKKAGK